MERKGAGRLQERGTRPVARHCYQIHLYHKPSTLLRLLAAQYCLLPHPWHHIFCNTPSLRTSDSSSPVLHLTGKIWCFTSSVKRDSLLRAKPPDSQRYEYSEKYCLRDSEALHHHFMPFLPLNQTVSNGEKQEVIPSSNEEKSELSQKWNIFQWVCFLEGNYFTFLKDDITEGEK